MARRGDKLREHILWIAKDAFLSLGFERTSMDEVASRAGTSKRSLYAHFESKENLFLAVIEFVKGLFLSKLKMPRDYSEDPAEALTLFCARYLEILLYQGSIQMCRVCMAEATRFPEGAAQHFDLMFKEVHTRLSGHLKAAFGLSARASAEAAQRLQAQLLYPAFTRALFGMDVLAKSFDQEVLSPDYDLKPVRKIVTSVVGSLESA